MAIGFAMAVPVGPVGLLCIRRTLNYGLVIGLLSGLGAALADALFAAAAAGGLASLMDFLLAIERQLRVAGGVFLWRWASGRSSSTRSRRVRTPAATTTPPPTSEERRVMKEVHRRCISRWSEYH